MRLGNDLSAQYSKKNPHRRRNILNDSSGSFMHYQSIPSKLRYTNIFGFTSPLISMLKSCARITQFAHTTLSMIKSLLHSDWLINNNYFNHYI